jgi:hypothetical protein
MSLPNAAPIARGTYRYRLNGADAGVGEAWAVFRQPDGSSITRASRAAPAFGSSIEVDALERDGDLFEFEVRWRHSAEGAVPATTAHYSITRHHITAHGPTFNLQLATPSNLVVSPLLRIFQGRAIRRVAELGRGGRVPVLVPWILDPKDGERLLTPLIDHRSASRVGPASIEINGQIIAAQRYAYIGGRYDDSAEFYLGEDDVLLRYIFRESNGKVWDVRLSTFEPSSERIPNG